MTPVQFQLVTLAITKLFDLVTQLAKFKFHSQPEKLQEYTDARDAYRKALVAYAEGVAVAEDPKAVEPPVRSTPHTITANDPSMMPKSKPTPAPASPSSSSTPPPPPSRAASKDAKAS